VPVHVRLGLGVYMLKTSDPLIYGFDLQIVV